MGFADACIGCRRLLAIAALLAVPGVGVAQTPDPKAAFVQALSRFSVALEGGFGDEGPSLTAGLDAMQRGLDEWDAAIGGYEQAMRGDVRAAPPALAARMHLALGAVYLDRGRVDAAMQELASSIALDASLAEAHMLRGLVWAQAPETAAQAAAAFGRALALDAGSPVRAYLLARHLTRRGEVDAASAARAVVIMSYEERPAGTADTAVAPFVRLQLVPESAGVEPFFPPALYADGFARLQRGDYAGAVAALRQGVSRDPVASRRGAEGAPMAAASSAYRDGDVAAALSHLERASAAAPGDAEVARLRGMILLADEQHDAAQASLREAVRLDGADERARLALAEALLRAGRPAEAAQALRDTIQAIPRSGRARYLLARAFERQGRYPEAAAALEDSLTFGPLVAVNAIHQTLGAIHLARQDVAAARDAFGRRVDLVPNDADAHRDLGTALARLGESDAALTELAVAALLEPASVDTHTAIARTRLEQGHYAHAAAAAQRALALAPRHAEARYLLANALIRDGRTDEGARELEVFAGLQAEEAAAKARQFELGTLRREAAVSAAQNDHAREVALLRQAVALDPSSGAQLDLGLALLRADQPAAAVEALSQAIVAGAGRDAYRHLAEAYRAAGRGEESRKAMDVYQRLKRDALRAAGANP